LDGEVDEAFPTGRLARIFLALLEAILARP
jgi:hypothetical protein